MKEIADSGIKIIIAGSSVGELAMHYLNRFNIAVLKVLSKFDLRRLCRVVNATPLARVGAPTPEEAGHVDVFETIEIGGDRVTVLRQLALGDAGFNPTGEKTRTATIVLRGATSNHLDDLERAIDDGVNVIKSLMKDPRMVPGAGASEMELAKRIDAYGSGLKGLSQHGVKKFASALESVPKMLAENALGGAESNEVLSRLWTKHEQSGGETWGVDVEVSSCYFRFMARVNLGCRLNQTEHFKLIVIKFTTRSLLRIGPSNWLPKLRTPFSVWIASS
jgi:T-complex protein 1 subunit theta